MTCPRFEELELRSLDFKPHTPHHNMIHKAFLNTIFWNIPLPPTAFSWLWWVFFLSFYVSNRAGHPEAEWIYTWQCITVGTLEVARACMLSTNYHTCFSTTTNTRWSVPNLPPATWNTSVPKIHQLFQHLVPYLQSQGSTANTLHSFCFPGMFLDTHVGVAQRNRSESWFGTVLEFGLFKNTICLPYGLVDIASLSDSCSFSTVAPLTFGATEFFVVGALLCIWRCLAASLASTYWIPVALTLLPGYNNRKCLQTLPNFQTSPNISGRGKTDYLCMCVCVCVCVYSFSL